ncbi:MAG: type II toxin-antitoxin system HicA family toxin [Verrucomicrobia bacterium]|nr:type II toxin-antitoxin system HicA family toxin [Verrucomicrobiota bacterium]
MKRRQFIQELSAAGAQFLRPRARHDIYWNPANGRKQPVPRHSEIDDHLAKHIRKQLGLAD